MGPPPPSKGQDSRVRTVLTASDYAKDPEFGSEGVYLCLGDTSPVPQLYFHNCMAWHLQEFTLPSGKLGTGRTRPGLSKAPWEGGGLKPLTYCVSLG